MTIAYTKELEKSFGDNRVLRGVSVEIQRGHCTFVVGPSGTGKSVLVKHFVGLLRPDAGEVFYDGNRVDQLPERELFEIRKRCVYVYQHPTLFDSMSVLENVSMVIRHHYGVNKKKADKMALDQLERLHIGDFATSRPHELAAGAQKMVSLARALSLKPETLILDEPTTGLDPYAAMELDQLVAGLEEEGMTLIIISHDLRSTQRLADEVIFLLDGKVRQKSSKEGFFASEDPAVYQFVNGLTEGEI
jgi:phospholipid/cholesterol/gamma-HCH transport system ATP-binding protein